MPDELHDLYQASELLDLHIVSYYRQKLVITPHKPVTDVMVFICIAQMYIYEIKRELSSNTVLPSTKSEKDLPLTKHFLSLHKDQ